VFSANGAAFIASLGASAPGTHAARNISAEGAIH